MSLVETKTVDFMHTLATSFGGVIAYQIWADFYLWELVLNDRPDLVAIVEIGTQQGGFSRYLSCQASLRSLDFYTYDVVVPDDPPYEFERRDVFAEAETMCLELASSPGPIVLFCDGGNKAREARTFAPALPPRSLLAVHDWETEFMVDDIPDGLVDVYGTVCERLGSMSRFFLIPEAEPETNLEGG